MDLPLLAVPHTDCPVCAHELRSHPADGCACSTLYCHERATTRVTRGVRFRPLPYCDTHVRMHVVQAERFGYALVLQALPRDVPLTLS